MSIDITHTPGAPRIHEGNAICAWPGWPTYAKGPYVCDVYEAKEYHHVATVKFDDLNEIPPEAVIVDIVSAGQPTD